MCFRLLQILLAICIERKNASENVLSYLLIKEGKVCGRSFDKTLIPLRTATKQQQQQKQPYFLYPSSFFFRSLEKFDRAYC